MPGTLCCAMCGTVPVYAQLCRPSAIPDDVWHGQLCSSQTGCIWWSEVERDMAEGRSCTRPHADPALFTARQAFATDKVPVSEASLGRILAILASLPTPERDDTAAVSAAADEATRLVGAAMKWCRQCAPSARPVRLDWGGADWL